MDQNEEKLVYGILVKIETRLAQIASALDVIAKAAKQEAETTKPKPPKSPIRP